MKITNLLKNLPSWPSHVMYRRLAQIVRTPVQEAVSDIVSRVMGDVLDWLRLTPNAVV